MFYVYLIRSQTYPEQIYIGFTGDLRCRIAEHNAGKSIHTRKYLPWRLITYIAFSSKAQGERFEKYLKTGSGRAFGKRHLW